MVSVWDAALHLKASQQASYRSCGTLKDAHFAVLQGAIQSLHELLLDGVGLVGKCKCGHFVGHATAYTCMTHIGKRGEVIQLFNSTTFKIKTVGPLN